MTPAPRETTEQFVERLRAAEQQRQPEMARGDVGDPEKWKLFGPDASITWRDPAPERTPNAPTNDEPTAEDYLR